MDIFLQQNARPLQTHGEESPALSAERPEQPSHRSGHNRGDAANKLLSALLTEYDHDHEEYRRGRAQPMLSTAWETALKTNKIAKLISSAGGESVKVTALEALVTEQAAKLKTAADEAHKATTKLETMNKRLTELEQLCSKRWKETKANFGSDESGSESSRPATPNGGRGGVLRLGR